MIIDYALLVLASYLVGAIPWGYIVGRVQGIDVRKHGSGKIGATNTLRTLGTRSSAVVFIADMAKGVVVVLLARYFLQSPTAEVIAALAAMVGHNWSIYIGFYGGRGVTISFGSTLAIFPPLAFLGIVVFVAVIAVTKYVSLGSVIGVCSVALALAVLAASGVLHIEYVTYALIGAPLVVFAHWDNIHRLRTGRERKLGERAEIRDV